MPATHAGGSVRDTAIISLVEGAVSFLTHIIIDPRLRKDAVAKSVKPTQHDEGTSRLIQVVFLLSWLLLFLTALPNQFQTGVVEPHLVFTALGIVLAAAGFLIRVVAMRTLGEFFTEPFGFVKSIGLFWKASIGVFVTLAIWEPFCFSLDQASPQPTSSLPCSSWR